MKTKLLNDVYAILDANFNRAKEGLRVCEDIARFHLKNKTLTARTGRLRHDLTIALGGSRIISKKLLASRDTKKDPGRAFALGPKRTSFQEIFAANAQRVKEALRVLEEFSKILDTQTSRRIQKIRFRFYDCEKETLTRFPSLPDPR